MDVKAEFEQAVENGEDPPAVAAGLLQTATAREILDEFPEDERDATFWEECSGLIFAAAVLQVEHDVVQPETRKLAAEAIAQERQTGADDERLRLLTDLERQLE
ncbi:hypothetical protein [Alienimonas sp. DA493]|uniref:hypothetical protein n=1 Tax=Alienimonas sp. DA493 TaxID=3373605 RepID=UPI003754E67B